MENDPQRIAQPSVVVPGVRRSVARSLQGALIEKGVWSKVRAHLLANNPAALREFDHTEMREWFNVETHIALLDAAAAIVGVDGIREIGRERIRGLQTSAFFPAIVGSWTRTYRDGKNLVQVFPHLWRASSILTGELVLKELTDSYAKFRFENLLSIVAHSDPWRATIEGMALGLLERVELNGESKATATPEGDAVDFMISWNGRQA